MPFPLPSYRVRLQSDYPVAGSIIDRLTGLPLKLPRASAWKIEIGIFAGLNGGAPSSAAQVVSTSGWTALTVTFQSSSGTNMVSKSTGTFTSPTYATWNDDTAQHATVELTDAEANITPGRYKVTVVVDDYVVGTGDVEVFEAYNFNTLDPADTNPGAPISQDAADLRYEFALGNPGTNGFVLSSTTAGVRSWVAQSGGGSGGVTTDGNNVFTGTNDFGPGKFDPSDATFSDLPTLRVADSSYIMAAGDATGEGGYLVSSGGEMILESTLNATAYNIGQGVLTGASSGTISLATQALSGTWSFYGLASNAATTPQFTLDRGATVKARVGAAKSATDTFWTGLDFTINSTIGLDGISGGSADDSNRSPWLLQGEYEWTNGTTRRQSELNSTFANRRWMNAVVRTQVGLSTCGTGTGTITITCVEAHGMTGTPSVYISGTNSTPSIDGTYVATPTTSTQFTITFAGTITVALTAGWLYDASSNYKYGGINFTIPLLWDIPEYEIGTGLGTSAWYLRKVGTAAEAAEFTIDGGATGSSANIAALRLTTHSGAAWNGTLGTKKGEYVWYVGFDAGFSRSDANTFGLWDGVSSAWRQWITAAGNMGIGTTTPASKLEVNGTVTATNFVATEAVTAEVTVVGKENVAAGEAGVTTGAFTIYGATSGSPSISASTAAGSGTFLVRSTTGSHTLVDTTSINNATLPGSFTTLAANGEKTFTVSGGAADSIFIRSNSNRAGNGVTTTGIQNVCIGSGAGMALTSGHRNIFIGQNAGSAATGNERNVSIGDGAGPGYAYNVSIGAAAAASAASTYFHVAVGYTALPALTGGNGTVGIGYNAGPSVTGAHNTIIGYSAGATLTNGTYCTMLGSGTAGIAGSNNYQTAIGAGAVTTAANQVMLGRAADAVVVPGTLSVTGDVIFAKTITAAATTGAQTINKTTGAVNFAASATSLVVTNSLVTANSVIICTVGANDTTMKSVAAVAASGSFTMYADAAPTAETRVYFQVTN